MKPRAYGYTEPYEDGDEKGCDACVMIDMPDGRTIIFEAGFPTHELAGQWRIDFEKLLDGATVEIREL